MAVAQSAPGATHKSVPKQAHPAATSPQSSPAPDEGTIAGNTYSSDYFAFDYIFPQNLEPEDDFMQGSQDQENRSFVLLAAYGEGTSAEGREGVVIWADRLTTSGAPDLSAYLAQITNNVLKPQKYEPLAAPADQTVAGRHFLRGNFRKNDVYESVMVTLARGYAINFLFTGPSQEQVDKLAASLNTLRFAAAKSAAAAKPKTTAPSAKPSETRK